ncbi:hypothetical protein C2845_PM06G33220 [Panicum miliaceum]|uniref:Uncharacterized protein n=1 Tax=Panicum miliaceum TaxID=4540 RepID=A0A3L6R9I9_PANMI|nr:hypothetical protein C2845_PM06G33220 [Panicum miliaceum]
MHQPQLLRAVQRSMVTDAGLIGTVHPHPPREFQPSGRRVLSRRGRSTPPLTHLPCMLAPQKHGRWKLGS